MSTGGATAAGEVDVVCLGAALVNLIGVEPSVTLDGVTTFKRSIGGAPVEVAATVARLGHRAAIVARVGDDAFGRYLRAEASRFGIQVDWLQVDPQERTTLAFQAQTAGSHDFLAVRGADRLLELDSPTRGLIERSAALHTTTFALATEPIRSAAIEAIELAHGAGRLVSLDPNFRARNWSNAGALMPLLQHLLPLTTVIKPSLSDAEAIWGPGQTPGDYIERFHAHGAPQVLLSLGREGVVVSNGRTIQRLAALPVDTTDTAGVGDAFTAAVILALIDGHDLVTAARVGTLVASYRLRMVSRTAPLPSWAVIVDQARSFEEPTASLLMSPRPTRGG